MSYKPNYVAMHMPREALDDYLRYLREIAATATGVKKEAFEKEILNVVMQVRNKHKHAELN